MAEHSGFAVILQLEGAGAVFAAVAQVRDIEGPGIEVDDVDASHRGSRLKKFQPGMIDNGEVKFDIVYDPALHSTLYGLIGTEKNWKLVMPDSGAETWAFSGYIKGWSKKAPLADALTADITVKVNGSITVTA
jgi:hypothetical protein